MSEADSPPPRASRRLVRNAVECAVCHKVIESKSRHQWVTCGCSEGTFVDGGLVYQRRGWKHHPPIDRCEYVEVPE